MIKGLNFLYNPKFLLKAALLWLNFFSGTGRRTEFSVIWQSIRRKLTSLCQSPLTITMVNWALINRSCIKNIYKPFLLKTENAKFSGEVVPRPPRQFQRYSGSSNETIAPGQYFYSDPSAVSSQAQIWLGGVINILAMIFGTCCFSIWSREQMFWRTEIHLLKFNATHVLLLHINLWWLSDYSYTCSGALKWIRIITVSLEIHFHSNMSFAISNWNWTWYWYYIKPLQIANHP